MAESRCFAAKAQGYQGSAGFEVKVFHLPIAVTGGTAYFNTWWLLLSASGNRFPGTLKFS